MGTEDYIRQNYCVTCQPTLSKQFGITVQHSDTILHVLVKQGNVQLVDQLLRHVRHDEHCRQVSDAQTFSDLLETYLDMKDSEGRTAMDSAESNQEMIDCLNRFSKK